MGIHVSFVQPNFGGAQSNLVMGSGRASEAIADGASGSITAEDGEIAVISNTGSAVTYVAFGSAPSASASAQTSSTSARMAIPSGQIVVYAVKTGDSFAAAAS